MRGIRRHVGATIVIAVASIASLVAAALLGVTPATAPEAQALPPGFALLAQQAHLFDPDGTDLSYFGQCVALDGDTAIVGAAYGSTGAAYVFVRSGTTWTLQQRLTASDEAYGDSFGVSVALDGDIALIGAYGVDIGANANQGSAYVFVRSGSTWTQQGPRLTASSDGASADYFGSSVAVSGTTAVVGEHANIADSNSAQGAAYVFTRSGTTWSRQWKLTASDGGTGDDFGWAVALDGDTALVGARDGDVVIPGFQGAAYAFTRSGTTWTQQQKLTASDPETTDWFGTDVALSGGTALDD